MSNAFDVVIVPDFTRSDSTFEMRTLFFLASWAENAGRAREFPLHVVCIGELPASVRWMAQRCSATISIHKSLRGKSQGFTNKLRGLEIEGQTERVLLLDTDVLVLGDPSDLSDLGHCLAASPENSPKVPEEYWTKIYAALGMDFPTERIACIRGELGCPLLVTKNSAETQPNANSMVPSYNSGIVFAPWKSELRSLWEENVVKIAEMFEAEERNKQHGWQTVRACDQVGFTIAIQKLQQQGLPLKQLSSPLHANWLHFYRRSVTFDTANLYHAFIIFRTGGVVSNVNREVNRYGRYLLRGSYGEWKWNDRRRLDALFRYLLPALLDDLKMRRFMHKLRKLYVEPARQNN